MKAILIHTLFIVILVACTPSEAAIQTAIAETQQVATTNQGANPIVFEEPPIGAIDKAYEELAKYLALLPSLSGDVSDFVLDRSLRLSLNRADGLNTINERWCLGILYLLLDNWTGEYYELGDVFVVTHGGKGWEALEVSSSDNSTGILSSYQSNWEQCLFR